MAGCRLPLYFEAKVVTTVLLWHPRTRGAVYVFDKWLQPVLRNHEAAIDQSVEEVKARIADSLTRQMQRCVRGTSTRTHTTHTHIHTHTHTQSRRG